MNFRRYAVWVFCILIVFVIVVSGFNNSHARGVESTYAPTLSAVERMVAIQATKVASDVDAFNRARYAVIAYRWEDALSTFGPVVLLLLALPSAWFLACWLHDVLNANVWHRRIHRATTGNVLLGTDEYGNVIATPLEPAFSDSHSGVRNSGETYTRRIKSMSGEEMVTEVSTGEGELEPAAIEPLPDADDRTLIESFFERAMRVAGRSSVRVPTHGDMHISGRQWDKVINHPGVSPILDIKRGRGGGTFLRSDGYVNLRQVYVAVRRGEIPTPLP